jgi:hypothetical protein
LEVWQNTHQHPLPWSLLQQCCYTPFFSFLPEEKKNGNSDHIDRIDIVELFIDVFGKDKMGVLLADREFIGDKWLNWMEQEDIKFVMRIKEEGQYISNSRGMFVKAKQLLHSLNPGQSISLGKRTLGKSSQCHHYLSAYRCPKTSELLVVVHDKNTQLPCELYKYRWQIETMFKALKSSGFNMEDTHITDPLRLETLFSVMAIAFTIAYDIGDEYEKVHPQTLKKHGYKPKATFRIGLDLILHWFINYKNKLIRELKRIVRKASYCWGNELVGVKNVL